MLDFKSIFVNERFWIVVFEEQLEILYWLCFEFFYFIDIVEMFFCQLRVLKYLVFKVIKQFKLLGVVV